MGIKNFQTYAEIFFGPDSLGGFNTYDHDSRDAATGATCSDARIGVYIDLSSYIYGEIMCIMKGMDITQPPASEKHNATTDDNKTYVVRLAGEEVDHIVKICTQSIVRRLEPLLSRADRVCLAYDSFPPKAKYFEQTRRRKRLHFSLSPDSRDACYSGIVQRVKDMVVDARIITVCGEMTNRGEADAIAETINRQAIEQKVFPSKCEQFTVGEGEWKCFYRIYSDITDRTVDTCYVFGRDWDIGLAMTMYQHPSVPSAIKYVYGHDTMFQHTKLLDSRERMLHFVCLSLIGNDYIGKLVNLSETNATRMKAELDVMYRGDAGPCTTEQLDYLSAVLFSCDRDPTERVRTSDDSERGKLSRAFATVVLRLLAAVYGDKTKSLHPKTVEDVLHYAGVGPFTSNGGPNKYACILRKHLINRRKKNELQQDEGGDTNQVTHSTTNACNENTKLSCVDAVGNQVARTLQQCMDSFAVATLWYLSYTTFYFRSASCRETMRTARRADEIKLPMDIGMGDIEGEATFHYNDERLSQRYDICRLLELKKVLQNINCCRLYWIIESAFDKSLT